MEQSDLIRLRHMLDAARDAQNFARGRSRVDLDHDRMLVLALMKALEIVGEAAYQVSPLTQSQYPEIPWADIIGMRHRLVHGYFSFNLDILWKTIEDDLPHLISVLEAILGEEQEF